MQSPRYLAQITDPLAVEGLLFILFKYRRVPMEYVEPIKSKGL